MDGGHDRAMGRAGVGVAALEETVTAGTTTLTLCYYKRTDESPTLGSRTKGRFL